MDITFSSKKMQKLCNSEKEMRSELGERGARVLQTRLTQIRAAASLDELRTLPGARCHELSGDRKGELAVDLVHPKRLTFVPGNDPTPRKPDGGLDWKRVTQVEIVWIGDYH
jgi:plasmid maintenance system killer protein